MERFVCTVCALVSVLIGCTLADAQEELTFNNNASVIRPYWKESNVIRNFSLVNITTGRAVPGFDPIKNGAVVDLAKIPGGKITLRANLARSRALSVRRVQFTISGAKSVKNDFFAPYSVAGDARGKYREWRVIPGSYRVSAIALRSLKLSARASLPSVLRFTIVDSGVVQPTGTPDPAGDPIAAPTRAATPAPTAYIPPPPIPELDAWKQKMDFYGRQHCDQNTINQLTTWEGNVWYYDGMRVYYQLADYTKDTSWNICAGYVRDLYRTYVLSGNGAVPGWRVFTKGLLEDYLRRGDPLSKQAVIAMSYNSAYAWAGGGEVFGLSRETAYLVHAYLDAEALGEPRNPKLTTAVNFALGHLNQWSVLKNTPYVQPFMVGLTMEALIHYYNVTGDSRIPPAIQTAIDWLWDTQWNAQAKAFYYVSCKPGVTADLCTPQNQNPAPDLNLLIAPAFSWIWKRTGDIKYLQRGDQIFAGGVTGAWLGNGKQFNQNYRWSFEYVKARSE